MNRLSFLFVLGVAVAVTIGGLTGYIHWSNSSLETDVKKYDLKVSNLENEVVQYEGEHLEAAVSAKEAINVLKDDFIMWSDVIEKILSTTPKDLKTKLPLVEYTSYSGSQNNKLSISVKTIAGSKKPYSDVAELIRAFSGSDYFANPFVPSISTGFSGEGGMTLIFNFGVDLVGENDGQVEEKSENKESEEKKSVPVS